MKTWPASLEQDKQHSPRGEIGTLRRVWMHPGLDTYLFLFIDHDENTFAGLMVFDDRRFCLDVHNLLRNYLGRLIAEIGNLDLSYTF